MHKRNESGDHRSNIPRSTPCLFMKVCKSGAYRFVAFEPPIIGDYHNFRWRKRIVIWQFK